MILYHITSLEKPIQSILIPKIPDETEIGENYTEKRICLAPSILECLKSAEIVNKFDDEVGLVRVYKVKINEDDPNLVGWNKLYEEGLVPDAALTHEYWYKKPIMPIECSVYRVSGWTKKEYIIVDAVQKEQIKKIAVDGAKLLKELADEVDGNFSFEYSPESFTGTEVDYALEVCNAVLDVMQPTIDRPMIINLPVTVEMSMPHIYANQIEYCSDRLHYRDAVILSTHPHNDRGTGVADTELALLAGAQRVECCLFGNGERTGNVDAITLAMNMYSHGVDPKLDFSNMPHICEVYEEVTRMNVSCRQPYAGSLVFAAFSGSHQDAIAKGMNYREENHLHKWNVPYLPIDPHDVSREYDADVIRINSQSGKGGIGYILEKSYGYVMPAKMREDFGYRVKDVSDKSHAELKPDEIYSIFKEEYLNVSRPVEVLEAHFVQGDEIEAHVIARFGNQVHQIYDKGNGRLDAVSNALKQMLPNSFSLETYSEHSLDDGSHSRAASYVGIVCEDGHRAWGAGEDTDIIRAGIKALVSAINNQ